MTDDGTNTNPDGLIPVVLEKPWIGHDKGETVHVDPERKVWLESSGYVKMITAAKEDSTSKGEDIKETEKAVEVKVSKGN